MKLLILVLVGVYANDFIADKFGYDIMKANPEVVSVLATLVVLLVIRNLLKRRKK